MGKMEILHKQVKQIGKANYIKVICACCKKENPLGYMYRCFECELLFCSKCAADHFGMDKNEIMKKRLKLLDDAIDAIDANTMGSEHRKVILMPNIEFIEEIEKTLHVSFRGHTIEGSWEWIAKHMELYNSVKGKGDNNE
jgi:hypothetical protein